MMPTIERRLPAPLLERGHAVGLSTLELARRAGVAGRMLYGNEPLRPDSYERLDAVVTAAERSAATEATT